MGQPHYYQHGWIEPSTEHESFDVCVYGGNAAGVIAAVASRLQGKSVVLCHPGRYLGGMTTGGLGWTDVGNKDAIGGLARDVYRRVGGHYGEPETWKFEPQAAQSAVAELVAEHEIAVRYVRFLETVRMEGRGIRAVRFLGGSSVEAQVFIDTTYEGDLMAMAGVTYTTGREGNEVYGETYNGAQCMDKHQFDCDVDPYVRQGNRESGLLPHVVPSDIDEGRGDRRIQAYNFRVCMTDDPAIRRPFPKPAHYNPLQYELAARWLSCTTDSVFRKFDRLASGRKTDTNNYGAVSTDYIGANYRWPEASYPERELIFQRHVEYQQGLHWFMANDSRVPASVREAYATWGLASDEFRDTDNWPHQLYIREARRMVSDAVVTDNDCLGTHRFDHPVGMAAYQMDSHNCARIVRDGHVRNEGDVQIKLPAPYPIPFEAIVPRRGECGNLIVPVCVSASHIAFGSVRMEPVFMILAQSAAIAAAIAIDADCAVQDVPYADLKAALEAAGQILETSATNTGEINPA
jgi:hypothetical protein